MHTKSGSSNGSMEWKSRANERFSRVGVAGRFAVSGLVLLILLLVLQSPAMADSPPNLTADISWSAGFGGVADVETAYNFGRRQEEIQLGLAPGTLGNLVMPSQVVWDMNTVDEKALFLLNAERTARDGAWSGVIGLPFQDWQPDMKQVAQDYAGLLVNQNVFGHEYNGTPWDRIANNSMLGSCHEFLGYAENLAAFWTGGTVNQLPIERAIYNWIYDDAGSAWGHREAALLQDKTLSGNAFAGFKNNVDGPSSEGFIGIRRG